ncbi:MAG: carbohydrate porin [Myxococcota bacterium]
MRAAFLFLALLPLAAWADAPSDRFSAGGYFRVMTRPDFQGGDSKLGFWNLYGRLLNEGPYGALELKLDVLQAQPGTREVWASVHAKLEGGSFANTDAGNGSLARFRASQLYVKAGNILFDRVTWQLGTLENWFGDLGLYDLRPASLFTDTVGLSARYQLDWVELLLGVGDAGFAVRGPRYNTLFTTGGSARFRVGQHLELGVGGQLSHEPAVRGNRFAPYVTPGLDYEDYLRGEVAMRFLENHPGQADLFPKPEATSATSWKAVGYLGFGKLGPLRWSNLFVSYRRLHPESFVTETFDGREFTLYPTALTDERTQLMVGNEMQLRLWPERLDAVWAVLYGRDANRDNTIAAGDDNREYYSTVLRLQLYLTSTVHLLAESSVAREKSLNGNLYREHADSVFKNSGGVPDSRGLELGDTDTRNTWQLKTGVVLNPTGLGVYTRPSLRLLYGLQYSNQQAAFGNGFVESLDQYNVFPSPERHWHSVVAIEAEAWF